MIAFLVAMAGLLSVVGTARMAAPSVEKVIVGEVVPDVRNVGTQQTEQRYYLSVLLNPD